MASSTIIGLGAVAAGALVLYFLIRPPDVAGAIDNAAKEVDKAIKDNKQGLHDNAVRPLFDLFGYTTELAADGDTVLFRPKGPTTLGADRTFSEKDGTKTTLPKGTIIYPDDKIEVKPGLGGPKLHLPSYLKEQAIANRRAQGLGPGPWGAK